MHWPIYKTTCRQLMKKPIRLLFFIEKGALTRCQSVSVVAVSDVDVRCVVCALLPICLLTYLRSRAELAYGHGT